MALVHGTLTARDRLTGWSLLEHQDDLRRRIGTSLAQYPISYLYDDEVEASPAGCLQLQGFQAFLRHIRRTLHESPRSQSLKALTQKFRTAAVPPSPMAELYELLDLRNDVPALAVAEAVESVKPSRRYLQWQAACEAAKKPGRLECHEEKIREGLCRKARAQGLPVPSEEELQEQLSQILRSGVDRGVEHAERAARLRSELSLDPEHLRWQRVRSLWKESGGEELLAQYQALDRAQGDDRRIHGSDFEATDARLAASLAVALLQSRADLFPAAPSAVEAPDCEVKFLQGCTWHDSKRRICGEVDVVVLAGTPGEEAWQGLAVAIVEMKSGWFELPAALLLQHASKISSAQNGEASLYWNSHHIQLGDPYVFVATLIPHHPFVIGLDPELLRAVSKKLFQGNSVAPVEEDLAECEKLRNSLRADHHLRSRLSLSPHGLLQHPELKHRTARIHRDGSPGVVDSQLRVLGTTNLRVADTSVYPESPSGHSDAPARLVGELCARFVLRDIARATDPVKDHAGGPAVQLRGYRGVRMPLRGFGTNGVRGEKVRQSLTSFFQLGGRMVDTAVLYENHVDIGRVVANSKIPREEVFIVSKIPPTQMGLDESYEAVLRSVKELGTHLDLVLLHWPSNFDKKDPLPACASVSWRACRAAAWKGLERAYMEGKVRALGVSNFGVKHLSALLADGPSLPIAVNQIELHPWWPQLALRKYCKEKHIALMAYGSLGSSLLGGATLRSPAVAKVSKRVGRSPAQVLLRWAVQQGVAVIPQPVRATVVPWL
ncbi:unnamed protein product [Symbiodinium sp. CCMP2456]|nr:unnamed protein product [Symbiodinium sp. CCMP2456]